MTSLFDTFAATKKQPLIFSEAVSFITYFETPASSTRLNELHTSVFRKSQALNSEIHFKFKSCLFSRHTDENTSILIIFQRVQALGFCV